MKKVEIAKACAGIVIIFASFPFLILGGIVDEEMGKRYSWWFK